MIPSRTILILFLFGTFGPLGIVGARSTVHAAPPSWPGVAFPAARESAPIPCPDNRLRNPDFEEGFSARGRVDSVTALGWEPWHEVVSGGVARPVWQSRRSEAPGEDAFVRSGLWSQRVSEQSVLQSAGIWQRVSVRPGSQLIAAAWGRGWASEGDDPTRSVPSGRYLLAIGVDPMGGSDSSSTRVRWSNPVTVTDAWLPLWMELPAESSAATVFLRGQPVDALRNNAAHWDGICLREMGPVGEATSRPSASPRPSRTLDPELPTATPDLAQVQATLLAQVAATVRSEDLVARATERAGQPASRMAPVGGGFSAPAGGYDPSRLASGPAPAPLVDGQGAPPRSQMLGWLYDHSGIGVIVLAALFTGLMLGLGGVREHSGSMDIEGSRSEEAMGAAGAEASAADEESTDEHRARKRKG